MHQVAAVVPEDAAAGGAAPSRAGGLQQLSAVVLGRQVVQELSLPAGTLSHVEIVGGRPSAVLVDGWWY